MEEVCQAIISIASENGQSRLVPLAVDSEFNWFANTCEQIGSTMISLNSQNPFTFNNAENRTFAQQYRSWYQNGYVTTSRLYDSYTSDLFVAEECYMSIGNQSSSAWYCPDLIAQNTYPFQVGVAPIPQADPENPRSLARLLSLCLFEQADERETQAAWLFAKHLATDVVFQAQLSLRQGSSPVNTLVYENPTYQAALARADGNKYLLESAILASMKQGGFILSPSIYTNQLSSTISDLLTDCLSVKLNAGQTDAQLIEELFNQAETKLKEQCGL
jgi:ABC-type glycerol-3-phosphate transport system substrate-binding protein